MKTNPALASFSLEDILREIIYRLGYNLTDKDHTTLGGLKLTLKALL